MSTALIERRFRTRSRGAKHNLFHPPLTWHQLVLRSLHITMSVSRQHHSSSPDELYRPLPQSNDDPNELPMPADVELDGEEEDFSDPPAEDHIDSRIRWIYFVFGCSTLLPWNCARLSRLSIHSPTDSVATSLNHSDSIFPLQAKGVFISIHLRIISIFLVHGCQFSLVDILNSYIYTGTIQHIVCASVDIDQVAVGISRTKNICIHNRIGLPNPTIDNHHLCPRASPFLLFVRTDE